MSMEMDWARGPDTLAFQERLTGLLDCVETLAHRPRQYSVFALWFQPGPQASPCYTSCPENNQAVFSNLGVLLFQQHFLHRDYVLLTCKLLSLLSAGPCDKIRCCFVCLFIGFISPFMVLERCPCMKARWAGWWMGKRVVKVLDFHCSDQSTYPLYPYHTILFPLSFHLGTSESSLRWVECWGRFLCWNHPEALFQQRIVLWLSACLLFPGFPRDCS